MKLVHKSGSVQCGQNNPASYWRCTNQQSHGNNGLMTIITNIKKKAVLSLAEDLKKHDTCRKEKHFYHLDGTTHLFPELVFRDLSNPLPVSRNQELQIWYGQDWIDCTEGRNNATTCVDVYAWYA